LINFASGDMLSLNKQMAYIKGEFCGGAGLKAAGM
jgi:hypothetical protein